MTARPSPRNAAAANLARPGVTAALAAAVGALEGAISRAQAGSAWTNSASHTITPPNCGALSRSRAGRGRCASRRAAGRRAYAAGGVLGSRAEGLGWHGVVAPYHCSFLQFLVSRRMTRACAVVPPQVYACVEPLDVGVLELRNTLLCGARRHLRPSARWVVPPPPAWADARAVVQPRGRWQPSQRARSGTPGWRPSWRRS
jgi:hypothetical protein